MQIQGGVIQKLTNSAEKALEATPPRRKSRKESSPGKATPKPSPKVSPKPQPTPKKGQDGGNEVDDSDPIVTPGGVAATEQNLVCVACA